MQHGDYISKVFVLNVNCWCRSNLITIQLDWLAIANWAYADIFAVAVQFQYQDQFWIPHQKLHGAYFLDRCVEPQNMLI